MFSPGVGPPRSDHELHLRVAEIVLRLEDQRLEHRDRIEGRAPALGAIAVAKALDEPAPEILEIDRRFERLQRIADLAQPLQILRQTEKRPLFHRNPPRAPRGDGITKSAGPVGSCGCPAYYIHRSDSIPDGGDFIAEVEITSVTLSPKYYALSEARVISVLRGSYSGTAITIKSSGNGSCDIRPRVGQKGFVVGRVVPSSGDTFTIEALPGPRAAISTR